MAETISDPVSKAVSAFENLSPPQKRKATNLLLHSEEGVIESTPSIKYWTAAELLATEFPEPKWAVPGFLPVGLTVLAGRPKLGKSWLALQIAVAVSCGGYVLGRKVEHGSALYLALEDSPRRLKNRLQQMGGTTGELSLATSWPPLFQGGLAELELAARKSFSLMVIDTFSRLAGRADQDNVGEMTELFQILQRLALDNDIAILLVDHHRKNFGSGDPIDDILGSTAKSAVADAAWGLYKEQGKRGATLKVIGRDFEEQTLTLQFDQPTGSWQAEDQDNLTPQRVELLKLISEMDGASLNDLVEATGRNKGTVHRQLVELEEIGKVVNKKGMWIEVKQLLQPTQP